MTTFPLLRHCTAITDFSAEELQQILDLAFMYKHEYDNGIAHKKVLDSKTVSLIFEKPSLRTRIAFEAAVHALGGQPIFQSGVEVFSRADGHERESIHDIGKVLERYCHCIVARVHDHQSLVQLKDAVSVPVINALCDLHHPTQALADLMTIMWHKPQWQGSRVVYIGDGNNVAASLMHICTMMGLHFVCCSPEEHRIPHALWQLGLQYAQKHNTDCMHMTDPLEAANNADVIYTDTYVSMGDEADAEERLKVFAPYQVTSAIMEAAHPDAIFLHCLPAHRGEEVVSDVLESHQSKVFDLAECRMHTAKALLHFLLTSFPQS